MDNLEGRQVEIYSISLDKSISFGEFHKRIDGKYMLELNDGPWVYGVTVFEPCQVVKVDSEKNIIYLR